MAALRTALGVTLEDERLFAVALAAGLGEILLRSVLAGIHPLLFVCWPPVFAVLAMATVVPPVRADLGVESGPEGSGRPGWTRRLVAVGIVAVVGHAVALVLGSALFVLVDTPIRYGLYWFGVQEWITLEWTLLGPLLGIAICTAACWSLPTLTVVRLERGASAREALRETVTVALEQPRALLLLAVCAGGFGALAVLTGVAVESVSDGLGAVRAGLYSHVVTWVFLLPIAAAVSIGLAAFFALAATSLPSSSDRPLPLVRLLVVCLVLTALVTAAGAVRMGEVRPVDTAPEPLPADPDGLYATALENTDRANHDTRSWSPSSDESSVFVQKIDRDTRQFVLYWASDDATEWAYHSTGVMAAGPGVRGFSLGTWEMEDGRIGSAEPGYVYTANEYELYDPFPGVTGWTIVASDENTITLEVDDHDQLHPLADSSAHREVTDVNESWARATVDTERETLLETELRVNVTVGEPDREGFETHIDHHARQTYTVDEIGIDRPEEVGTPHLGELAWRLVVY
ncbi:hypothetical protein [Natronobiforma cellulositropha]|uniref:hypothetical protein n=1 Tax=Natronobiforma cellulositropha TaxID=1679076 RepID=UPI0021D5EE5C|nr:hypothetical protein [Natronobiforma cellulositropha]